MFVRDKCVEKEEQQFTNTGVTPKFRKTISRSLGTCEVCGEADDCNNC